MLKVDRTWLKRGHIGLQPETVPIDFTKIELVNRDRYTGKTPVRSQNGPCEVERRKASVLKAMLPASWSL